MIYLIFKFREYKGIRGARIKQKKSDRIKQSDQYYLIERFKQNQG